MKKHIINQVALLLLAGLSNCPSTLSKQKKTTTTTQGFLLIHGNAEHTQKLRRKSFDLLKSLSKTNLGKIMEEKIGTQVVNAAKSVASISAASKRDDFLKLMPKDGKNDFTALLAKYNLINQAGLKDLILPARLLIRLQNLIEELSSFQQQTKQFIREFHDIKTFWKDLNSHFTTTEQEEFLSMSAEAMNIISKACACHAVQEVKLKTPLTPTQLKLLETGDEIVNTSKSPVDIFNHTTIIALEIKDPETADRVLKPMYEDINNIECVEFAIRHLPTDFELSKEERDALELAAISYRINSRIQRVVKKMRKWTCAHAKISLREVSFHLTQLQETLNKVTDNVGPFKKSSDELVRLVEPVLRDLDELKKSTNALLEKLTEKTKTSAPKSDASQLGAPAGLAVAAVPPAQVPVAEAQAPILAAEPAPTPPPAQLVPPEVQAPAPIPPVATI